MATKTQVDETLTEEQVRVLLRAIVKELAALDARREVLQTLARGYEMWLRVFGSDEALGAAAPDEQGG